MAHGSQNADDKMWPPYIEKIFIDIMVDEQQKGNFKAPTWLLIMNALNEQTRKSLSPKQVIQKHNRLRQRQRQWRQLLSHTRLGWDETTQMVTASEEVWAHVAAADPKANVLRKSGCPSYDKLQQLFAPNATTSAFQISLNTPTSDSDEEHALEEEITNEARRTQVGRLQS
ncbi:L10-interacting MYB domain-containing protein isoform X1 [Quercus suber]|uniref:L10-interacting MYB domain-containing protein isoform X1 n=1 Tax=Quercus suber TaxID=58331 RepID=UPI0032DE772B